MDIDKALKEIEYIRSFGTSGIVPRWEAIDTVLSELKKCNKQLDEANAEKIEWKKIAEKLTDKVKKEVVFYDCEGINFCEISKGDFGQCFKHNSEAGCKQCIIDWARKEEENEK